MISEGLGYRSVTINLHRPAWDDFEASTVHGPQEARQTLLGKTSSWEQWAPYLAARFERCGAHHVPDDNLLLAVMRRRNGDVLGIISVDDPLDGRLPSDEDCDRLVALAQVAALAVEQAADAERDAGHRSALDRLLSLSLLTGEQRRRAGVCKPFALGSARRRFSARVCWLRRRAAAGGRERDAGMQRAGPPAQPLAPDW